MTSDEFAALIAELATSWSSGDGVRIASLFTEDAVYDDFMYGPHMGRAGIAHLVQDLCYRDGTDFHWEMFDPVFDGTKGYACWLSSFTSIVPQFHGKRVVMDGISRFVIRDGLIAEYRESVNGGVAMAQLGATPEQMGKASQRWTKWFEARPEIQQYRRAR